MTSESNTVLASDQLSATRSRAARGRWPGALVAVAGVVALAGCGDDGSRYGGNAAAAVEVSGAWARSSPAGVTDGAAYMTIESAADDQLIGVAAPADVAAAVHVHETVIGDAAAVGTAGDGTESTEGAGAAITMRQVSALDLPGGEAVVFDPGGLHMMLIGLAGPLESGSSFELTLTFAEAAPLTVTVDVRDDAP